MDTVSDVSIPYVVVVKASQVGGTEIINNICGYLIDQDPTTILVIQPTLEMAETWSKDRLSPMLRDMPALAQKVHDPRSRDSNNTLRQKVFRGGRLTIIGANAPAGLASRPIRVVLADEVDRYPASAGTEGDPLALASKRQQTYWNRKTVLCSTPVIKDRSVILREYEKSDQRLYYVPCPECETPQVLRWRQVRWDRSEGGEHLPHTAHYVCEACGSIWLDTERWEAIARATKQKNCGWIAQRKYEGIAGFHVSGLMSPWLTLKSIVTEFLGARRDPSLLQVWTNTVLGEGWEESREKIEPGSLASRGENYGPDSLPDDIRILTAGIDVQGDRLELQVVGWGLHEESWTADYEIIRGDPAKADVWHDLDRLLLTPYRTEGGRELRIRAACIDTGGHYANEVLNFAKSRRRRRIFAVKGAAGARPIWPKRSSRAGHKGGDQVFVVGVDTAKDTLFGRLRIAEPGPGYVHFPVHDSFDLVYFDQLTSEQVVTRKREGRPYRVWVLPSGKRNEALDTMVYALAARMSLPLRLDRISEMQPPPRPVEIVERELPVEVEKKPTPEPKAWQPPPTQGGWIGERRNWFS